jgi:hypothetical protein
MAVGAAVLVAAPLGLSHSTVDHQVTQLAASSQLLAASVTPASSFGTTPGRPMTDQPRRLPAAVIPAVHHDVRHLGAVVTLVAHHVSSSTPSTTRPSTVSPPVSGSHELIGDATWYDWHPGQCAVHYLPKGTEIWITDLATGKTISCLVTDYEADGSRAVDMNETSFAELAPLAQGVIRVKVTW